MPRIIRRPRSRFAEIGIVSATLALGLAFGQAPAAAAIREVTLASPDQALTYCQSGKMPAGDIAYIAGPAGTAQYGPDSSCAQQVPPQKTIVTKSVEAVGNKIKECTMPSAKKAVLFCQNGSMGEWDIDYISGKVGKTLSGPGYGCVVNYSTSSIGNAICR